MKKAARRTRQRRSTIPAMHMLIAAVLLVTMFGLAVGSSLRQSPTFDEGFYAVRGWAFLRTGHLMPLGHPPLTNILSGLGMLLEPDLPAPPTLDGWDENNAEQVSEDLLWQSGVNTNRVMFLARLPIIALGLLFGAVIWRWGRDEYGLWSASLALLLFAVSPNILAHTGLATTDLGVAAFYVAALYAWTRFLHRRTTRWLALSGIAFGLAQAAKFSALLLIPTLLVMTLWYVFRQGPLVVRPGRRLTRQGARRSPLPRLFQRLAARRFPRWTTAIAALALMGLVGLVSLWASYLFSLQPDALGIRYPLSAYLAELQHFLGLAAGGHRGYLLGRFSEFGWWWYHPLTLVFKMTLPEIILLAVATTLAAGRDIRRTEWEILVPALLYLGFSMISTLNVGVRYLLPVLPLLFLFSARIAYGPRQTGWLRPAVLGVAAVAQLTASLLGYPYYIAFFNRAVGGPENGYRLLADSNLDWGQGLVDLGSYLERRGVTGPIYLSYFGQADPAYYGVDYIALPGWPPPPPDPERPPFHPLNPAPGLYAISASNLIGVQMQEPDVFGYFRARRPVATIGHSIFIYEVAPEAPPNETAVPWLAQCVTQAHGAALGEDVLSDLTGEPGIRSFYFDCMQALPFPNTPGWILIQEEDEPVIDLGDPDFLGRNADGTPRYSIWHFTTPPASPESTVEFPSVPLPLPVAGYVELLGFHVNESQIRPGEEMVLTAWWRIRENPPAPVSIFAHLLAPDGSLLYAGDGLGVWTETWEPGMVFVQQHRFPTTRDTPTGSYILAVGLYVPSTGERYPVAESGERVIDQIVLRSIHISEDGAEEADNGTP